ncbi:hypothetical protein EI94DRAFT_1795779 [Lactarius quietus]|nr:hypothetical protein EI94DRAFT_1795779 [Lactarius quietus]
MSCNRCKGTSTDPYNFLLSCSECDKRWHHRCHIPPLSDADLTALIRATNENDIDNGLSSWIGRCCKRKRVQVQAIPEAVSRPLEVPKLQAHSVSPAPAFPPNPASIRQVSQKPDLSSVSTHDQTTSREGVAAPLKPDGEHATGDLALPGSQTPTVQRAMTVPSDMAATQPERSRTMPLPSTSYTASPLGNVASISVTESRPAPLREKSPPLTRTPPGQPTGPTDVQAHPRSPKRASTSGSVDPSLARSEPMEIDLDLPTLDLRALSLNRPPSFHRKTASRTHSPPPPSPTRPAPAEDDEIEDLYGPPLGFPSSHAPPSSPPHESPPQPPQPEPAPAPTPAGPRLLLPVLAAEDPRMLATLERHERRQAARPRQGMRKAPAVRRAGVKRGGFVLVAERTEAAPTELCCEPRGVFASYFARSGT